MHASYKNIYLQQTQVLPDILNALALPESVALLPRKPVAALERAVLLFLLLFRAEWNAGDAAPETEAQALSKANSGSIGHEDRHISEDDELAAGVSG